MCIGLVYLIRYPFPNGNPIDRIGGLLDSRTGSGRSPFVVGGGCVFGAVRDKLKWAMSDPERLRPGETRQTLTERAARHFARLAQSLRDQGHGPEEVAHFVNRLVFCMFAEDVGLLPNDMFTRMLRRARREPEKFADLARKLFGAMSTGGEVGFEDVDWFNGGLFARHGPSPQARGRTPEPHDLRARHDRGGRDDRRAGRSGPDDEGRLHPPEGAGAAGPRGGRSPSRRQGAGRAPPDRREPQPDRPRTELRGVGTGRDAGGGRACGRTRSRSAERRSAGLTVPKINGLGRSFAGVAAYCLHDTPEPDDRSPETSERVAWTDARNLATIRAERAARLMAATAKAAPDLKRLAGGARGGRKLAKPVLHYSLSWARDEAPTRQEMSRAVDGSLEVLGLEGHEALIVAHDDARHPHVHVVANRVDPQTGKAAKLGQQQARLSRWAEGYEREQGRIRCERRVKKNARRRADEEVLRPIWDRPLHWARFRREGGSLAV